MPLCGKKSSVENYCTLLGRGTSRTRSIEAKTSYKHLLRHENGAGGAPGHGATRRRLDLVRSAHHIITGSPVVGPRFCRSPTAFRQRFMACSCSPKRRPSHFLRTAPSSLHHMSVQGSWSPFAPPGCDCMRSSLPANVKKTSPAFGKTLDRANFRSKAPKIGRLERTQS